MGIPPWVGESICSFVTSELSFLKLVSVLNGGVSNFSSKPAQPIITAFEVKCVFWLVDWN